MNAAPLRAAQGEKSGMTTQRGATQETVVSFTCFICCSDSISRVDKIAFFVLRLIPARPKGYYY